MADDKRILCHIVGMNNLIKGEFIKNMNNKYPDMTIKDIDIITHKIRNEPKMVRWNKQLSNTKSKIRKKKLTQDIHKYWKTTLITKLNNIIKRNGKKSLILLGLCSYHKNHRLKVKIDTGNLFFLKIDSKKNARNIIEYNLDKYRKFIISGTFPAKYIDHTFLIKQRNRLVKIYTNMKYKQKSLKSIEKWIEIKLKDNINSKSNKIVYVGLEKEYDDKINVKKTYRRSRNKVRQMLGTDGETQVIGYTKKWLSMLSSLSDINNMINRGYIRKGGKVRPYIKEKYDGALKDLHRSCFIYIVNKNPFHKLGWFKYKSDKSVDILSKEYIYDIYNELKKAGVKMMEYKN